MIVHTHGDAVNLRVIGLVVIPVDCVLANDQSSTDGERELGVVRRCDENFVKVVHCWDDSGKIWGATREEECRVLENL